MPEFIRFQSAVPNRHGRYPDVFAMANGLAAAGMLAANDLAWLRTANDNANRAYPDPTAVTPGCYDPAVNPGARSWFKIDAVALIALTRDYLALLDRAGIAWVELRTSSPGRIVHEDEVQVVAVPYVHPGDWPFPGNGRIRKPL